MKNLFKTLKPFSQSLKSALLTIGLGALLILSYAPFHQAWVALVLLGLTFHRLSTLSPRAALGSAFYLGLGYYGLGVSWVFVSVSTFVSPAILSLLITAGLIILLSTSLCLSVYLIQKIKASALQRLVFIYPVAFVLYEWLITYHLLGFPWLMLGVPMVDLPLGEYAPIVGTMGVAYLLFLSAGLIATGYHRYYLLTAVIWLMSYYCASLSFIKIEPDRYTVSAIQGNIPAVNKWDPDHIDRSIRSMLKLTDQHWDSDWIIWSENALPLFHSEIQDFLIRLSQKAYSNDTALVVGLPIDEGDRYFNSALALGAGTGRYDKHHLVPFGEYPLWRDYTKAWLDQLHIPVSDFTPGRERQTLLKLKDQPIAVFSCFETIFFEHLRQQLQSAKAIIIMSDDGWFGHSFAAYQQSQISRMRAKELAHPIISVGNTGITALINAQGKIEQSLIPHEQDVLTLRLSLVQGKTPWAHYGNWTWITLILISLLLLSLINRAKRLNWRKHFKKYDDLSKLPI